MKILSYFTLCFFIHVSLCTYKNIFTGETEIPEGS